MPRRDRRRSIAPRRLPVAVATRRLLTRRGKHLREQSRDLTPEDLRVVKRAEVVLELSEALHERLSSNSRVAERLEEISKSLRGDPRRVRLGAIAD